MLIEKVVDQHRQVLGSLTQRRQVDGHRVDAVEEVKPESPVLSLLPKVSIGRANQPHIHAPRLLCPHPHKAAVLQHLQKLRLNRHIQPAHFIQEKGSPMR